MSRQCPNRNQNAAAAKNFLSTSCRNAGRTYRCNPEVAFSGIPRSHVDKSGNQVWDGVGRTFRRVSSKQGGVNCNTENCRFDRGKGTTVWYSERPRTREINTRCRSRSRSPENRGKSSNWNDVERSNFEASLPVDAYFKVFYINYTGGPG